MIIFDPSSAADGTRGSVCDELVEMIDLAPTFLEVQGGTVPDHILEGRSLLPFLRGNRPESWREFVVSEYDYSETPEANVLGLSPKQCRLFMIADHDWKFMHAEGGFASTLFDRRADPEEYNDLGQDPAYQWVIDLMYNRLASWARRLSQRTTMEDNELYELRNDGGLKPGILIGVHQSDELQAEFSDAYRGMSHPLPDEL